MLTLTYLRESVISSNETDYFLHEQLRRCYLACVKSCSFYVFFNYVTDKIVRVVLITLALMLRCMQTICVSVRKRLRARERE